MAQLPKFEHITPGKARVLLVDDQPVVRERLAQLIGSETDMSLCGETDDPRIALQLLATTKPDLIVTGLSLKDSHGLEFIKDLRLHYPDVRVLVFSMYDESVYAERAIRAGSSGFVSKRESTREVSRAIREILSGGIYLSSRVTGDTVRRFFGRSSNRPGSDLAKLSDRELEVLELIGRGRSTRQIAATLRLDIKTVETYRLRIKNKLGLRSMGELMMRAEELLRQARPSISCSKPLPVRSRSLTNARGL
jgi:DNA-binding NarL/FixJ family response regulator